MEDIVVVEEGRIATAVLTLYDNGIIVKKKN
jgi:hypothetical protein